MASPTPEAERRPAPAGPGPAAGGDPGPNPPTVRSPPPARRRRPGPVALTTIAVTTVLAIPLVVALIGLRSPRWYPVLDLAQTELRVRDVASAHPPLIGLVGRLGTQIRPGSHPGPLSFWALWPFYAVAGSSAWALRFASSVLSLLAMAGTLWLASRRGGARMVLAVGATLTVVLAAYGPRVPVEAWNPYLPAFWWIAVVLGAWSVLERDLVALPLTVLAASMCAQTHVSYLGLVGGMAVLVAATLAVQAHRRRGERGELRRIAEWTGASALLGVVLWLPPVAQQIAGRDPNLSIIWDEFNHPAEPPIGLRHGLEAVLASMNPVRLVSGVPETTSGPLLPGLLLVALWAVAAVVAWRSIDDRRPAHLHAVLGVTLVLALVSARSIHGTLWYYLLLWCWSLAALMLLAIAWTGWAWWRRGWGEPGRRGHRDAAVTAVTALAAAVAVAFTGVSTARAVDYRTSSDSQSEALGDVVPPTVAYLRRLPDRTGDRPRLMVTFTDPLNLGSQGWGLLNELVRAGFDARVPPAQGAGAGGDHRVTTASEATYVVHLSVGHDIAVWDRLPGARRVAYADPRTPAERAEYARLRRHLIGRLRSLGRPDLVPAVDRLLFGVGVDPGMPPDVDRTVNRMLEIGLPIAVFVGRARPAG